jgi:hypothetical protein
MHSFDNAVRFQDEIIVAPRNLDNRAVVSCSGKGFSRSYARKINQDFVEQSVFAESSEFH